MNELEPPGERIPSEPLIPSFYLLLLLLLLCESRPCPSPDQYLYIAQLKRTVSPFAGIDFRGNSKQAEAAKLWTIVLLYERVFIRLYVLRRYYVSDYIVQSLIRLYCFFIQIPLILLDSNGLVKKGENRIYSFLSSFLLLDSVFVLITLFISINLKKSYTYIYSYVKTWLFSRKNI